MAELFCGVDDDVFTQKDCGVDFGGLVAVAFIDKDTPSPSTADLESTSWWTDKTGTSPPTVFLVLETRGSYPPASAVEQEGLGLSGPQVTGFDHAINFKVEDLKENRDFFENKNRRKYKFAFLMASDILGFIDDPVTVAARADVQEEITSMALWNVDIKWATLSNPFFVDKPANVFD